MKEILNAEMISQIDTFTLQQKIQQLQTLQNRVQYQQIIKLAKLELIDRLQLQQFGRQLANDQYFIQDYFKLPNIQDFKPKTNHKISQTKTRKDFIIKLQSNLATSGKILKVGKSAINYKYKPKIQKIQNKQISKKFLKAKKYESTVKNPKYEKKQKQQNIKQQKYFECNPICKNQVYSNEQKQQIKKDNNKNNTYTNLKQKLIRQVKQLGNHYQQNDVYEDIKQQKITPYNLKQQQDKILQLEYIEEINKFDQIKQINIQQQQIKQKIEAQQKLNKQLIKKQQTKQQTIHQHQTKIYDLDNVSSFNNYFYTSDNIAQQKIIQQIPYKTIKHQQKHQQKSQLKYKILFSQISPDRHQQNNKQQIKNSKQIRSKSLKNFKIIKKNTEQFNTNHISIVNNPSSIVKNINKDDVKTKTHIFNISNSNFIHTRSSNITKTINQLIFPYHQIYPNFQKLFIHSKNILNTYRNIQQHLRIHNDKIINNKSITNQYLKINQNQITFRIVSQCEKAKKYKQLFNIQLQTFHQRGQLMLERVKYNQQQQNKNNILLYRVVRTKQQVYDIINSSFHRTKNWYQLPHGLQLKTISWNLLWTWSKPQIDFQDLLIFQKVNHFIGNKQIARKDLLKKNIQYIQKLSPKIKIFFDIIPQTFLLPGQNIQFIKKFRQNQYKNQQNYWIMKPVGLSRGRGISLINKLEDINISEPIVLQKYLMDPLLIDGYKFDMRIYVLVTSINPLQGFARLSTQKYTKQQSQMQNKFVHLTNFSIQKQNINDKKLTLQQKLGGCKITLRMLSQKLKQMKIQWKIIQKQIQQIILKSLVACMNTIPQNPNCFQLFGYDIFIDNNLKCWLIQVNSSPSLQKQFFLDEIVKQQLVDDIVQIVNPMGFDRSRLLEVIERRRKQAQGLKSAINTYINSHNQLNEDLHYILHGKKIRKYGEICNNKNFRMIAPSQKYYSIVKTIQHYKIDPIIKN